MSTRTASIIAGIVLGLVCLAVSALIILFIPTAKQATGYVTPIVTSIPAEPLVTPPTPEATPIPTATLTEGIPPNTNADLQIGMNVSIQGTGGDGLRLRREAGMQGTPIFLGAENELFAIKGGPKEADGFIWWYLEAPYDASRAGWAVSNYLAVASQ